MNLNDLNFQARGIPMKLLYFPVLVGVFTVTGQISVTFVDQFVLGNTDVKFDNWTSLTIVAVFSAICALPIAIAAGLARLMLHRVLSASPVPAECIAAILSSAVLVFVICSIIIWKIPVGGMAGLVFILPVVSFVTSTAALIGISRVYRARPGSPSNSR